MNSNIVGDFKESETRVKFISGGHRHTISPFYAVSKETKKSIGSINFTVGNHEWQIVCYPGGETPEVNEFVSLFLGYRGPNQECTANWRLTLINQTDPSKNRSRAWLKGDKFNKFMTGRRWGWQRFIKRSDLVDPENGFIKDDMIIFEASLDVYLKQTTIEKKDPKFEPVLYPVPPSQLKSDFLFLLESANTEFEKNSSLSATPSLADVRFVVDGGSACLYAHSQILASRSPVLFRMFALSDGESKSFALKKNEEGQVTFNIPEIDGSIFFEVLKFIYTDTLDWNLAERNISNSGNKKRSPTAVPSSTVDPENSEISVRSKKRKTSNSLTSQSLDSVLPSAANPAGSPNPSKRPESAQPHNSYALSTSGPFFDSSVSDIGENYDTMESDSYELKYRENNTDPASTTLSIALSILEVADRYELNRLRLLTEHKISQVLSDQINMVNADGMEVKGGPGICTAPQSLRPLRKYYPKTAFKKSLRGLSLFSTLDKSEQEQRLKEEAWSNNFLDVLAVADRHQSKKLKKLCFSMLTSDALTKQTKRILLSSDKLDTLDKRLMTEIVQFLAVSDIIVPGIEDEHPDLANSNGAPEGGRENFAESKSEVKQEMRKEIYEMHQSELKAELGERGYSVRGDRAELVRRLEAARNYRDDSQELQEDNRGES